MGTIKAVDFERSGISKGMKVAALVLMLTAAALATDHVGFTPSARPVSAPIAAAQAAYTAGAVDGFALPAELRHPTSADAATQPESF